MFLVARKSMLLSVVKNVMTISVHISVERLY